MKCKCMPIRAEKRCSAAKSAKCWPRALFLQRFKSTSLLYINLQSIFCGVLSATEGNCVGMNFRRSWSWNINDSQPDQASTTANKSYIVLGGNPGSHTVPIAQTRRDQHDFRRVVTTHTNTAKNVQWYSTIPWANQADSWMSPVGNWRYVVTYLKRLSTGTIQSL
jgi:hypothetical protein